MTARKGAKRRRRARVNVREGLGTMIVDGYLPDGRHYARLILLSGESPDTWSRWMREMCEGNEQVFDCIKQPQ